MPYSIQPSAGLLTVEYSGTLTGTDIHDSINELESLVQSLEQWPDNLVDMRSIELSALTFPDLMSVAKRREAVIPPNPIRTAIVADQPATMGFARMFQSLNHNPKITIQVFGDLAEAVAWLHSAR
ncbi:MAG TPA: STAS/SEC14 domain-containing protein [Vicinamibacterales bacterium]|nr:STAS/SEC14 domain-containing protein [Vicinamibacterales bacterium]